MRFVEYTVVQIVLYEESLLSTFQDRDIEHGEHSLGEIYPAVF